MSKRIALLLLVWIIFYGMTLAQTNITSEDGTASLEAWAKDAKSLAHWFVSVGLLIGIIPAARKWFMAEPNAHKNIIGWVIALGLSNLLIEGIYELFIVFATKSSV